MDPQDVLTSGDSSDSEQETTPRTGNHNPYLVVPSARNRAASSFSPTRAISSASSARTASPAIQAPISILPSQRTEDDPPNLYALDYSIDETEQDASAIAMSNYSSSSQDDSVYSTPGPSQYHLVSPGTVNDPRDLSQVSPGFVFENRAQLIQSLQSHQVNTVTDLRRIERILAAYGTQDVTGPMTRAWSYYVESGNFLTELRGLNHNYPFSSECLDEARWAVQNDWQSTRSWNLCWLILVKIQNNRLVQKHARNLAATREMWGDYNPTQSEVEMLANNMIVAWNNAVAYMLRHWADGAPSR